MKTLRGRPRNISDSGIIYLDSDGDDDSDVSDSDVEPVFFPALGFGEVIEIEEFVPASSDNEDDSSDESFLELSQPDNFEEVAQNNPDVPASPPPPSDNVDNQQQQEVPDPTPNPIQFFGGTVQVRHIINESFVQLQHQLPDSGVILQNQPSSSANTAGTAPEPSSSAMSNSEGNSSVCSGSVSTKENQPIETEMSETAGPSSSSARLVPYLELQGVQDNTGSFRHLHDESPTRLSLKRKEPVNSDTDDEESNGKNEDNEYECDSQPEDKGQSPSSRTKRIVGKSAKREEDDEEEETCNPMVSEDEEETEQAYRGDRIGNTVYSERHVLRILMRWVEALPQHSIEKLVHARDEDKVPEEIIEKEILQLHPEFEEQMALLWDMSSETDVMSFLVENKVFVIIRDTLENSVCNRLIEVALGILANVISEPSIIEDFTVHDSSLQMVEKVSEICAKVSNVAVLIQAFSVLRRIVWYLRNFCFMKKWTDLLLAPGFLQCSNFIMSSSTNALLLGNVVVFFFAFLDSLTPEGDDDEGTERADEEEANDKSGSSTTSSNQESSSSSSVKNKKPDPNQKLTKLQSLQENYEPICASEFVPALCEGLKELMKNPKPPRTRRKLTSTRENPQLQSSSDCQTDEHCLNADDVDVPIPEGHIQQAILKGFSSLALLQKAPNGQNSIKNHAKHVLNVLLDFYRVFSICSEATPRSDALEYFTLSLHLLSFCHCHLDSVNMEAILTPVSTASKLINQEERDKEVDMVIRVQLKDGIEFDSVSYVALVIHEYLAAVAEKFGPECALKARSNENHAKIFSVLDKVVAKFTDDKL